MSAALVIAGLALVAAAVPVVWLWWLRRQWLVVTVAGPSMEPTYAEGGRVLARRIDPSGLRRDLVIVARVPPLPPGWEPEPGTSAPAAVPNGLGALMVKRVAALPRDPVPPRVASALNLEDGASVPAGHVVLLGDNVDVSWDSRAFGYVPITDVVGAVRRPLAR